MIYRQGHRFCIGIRYIVSEFPGHEAVYWNPKKKVFQAEATDCWSELCYEDEVVAAFTRKVIFKEIK